MTQQTSYEYAHLLHGAFSNRCLVFMINQPGRPTWICISHASICRLCHPTLMILPLRETDPSENDASSHRTRPPRTCALLHAAQEKGRDRLPSSTWKIPEHRYQNLRRPVWRLLRYAWCGRSVNPFLHQSKPLPSRQP